MSLRDSPSGGRPGRSAWRRIVGAVVLYVTGAVPALAGPPLFSDDPNTVGPGNLEVIVAGSGLGVGGNEDLAVPIVDLTLGVLDGLDLILNASPLFEFRPMGRVETTGALQAGAKWQPVRGESWNAAFTPAVSFGFPVNDEVTVVLPVQIEYVWSGFAVGTDVSYLAVSNAPDLWFAGLYGAFLATDRLTLLGEVVAFESPADQSAQFLLNLGFDWTLPFDAQLLASAGPGLGTTRGDKIDWHAFLGLQWNFELWLGH